MFKILATIALLNTTNAQIPDAWVTEACDDYLSIEQCTKDISEKEDGAEALPCEAEFGTEGTKLAEVVTVAAAADAAEEGQAGDGFYTMAEYQAKCLAAQLLLTDSTDKCLMATSSIAADATPDGDTVYTCSSYDNAGTSVPTETQIADFTLTGSWAATTEAAAEEDDATDEESTDDAAADGASNLVAGAAAMVALMVANI